MNTKLIITLKRFYVIVFFLSLLMLAFMLNDYLDFKHIFNRPIEINKVSEYLDLFNQVKSLSHITFSFFVTNIVVMMLVYFSINNQRMIFHLNEKGFIFVSIIIFSFSFYLAEKYIDMYFNKFTMDNTNEMLYCTMIGQYGADAFFESRFSPYNNLNSDVESVVLRPIIALSACKNEYKLYTFESSKEVEKLVNLAIDDKYTNMIENKYLDFFRGDNKESIELRRVYNFLIKNFDVIYESDKLIYRSKSIKSAQPILARYEKFLNDGLYDIVNPQNWIFFRSTLASHTLSNDIGEISLRRLTARLRNMKHDNYVTKNELFSEILIELSKHIKVKTQNINIDPDIIRKIADVKLKYIDFEKKYSKIEAISLVQKRVHKKIDYQYFKKLGIMPSFFAQLTFSQLLFVTIFLISGFSLIYIVIFSLFMMLSIKFIFRYEFSKILIFFSLIQPSVYLYLYFYLPSPNWYGDFSFSLITSGYQLLYPALKAIIFIEGLINNFI